MYFKRGSSRLVLVVGNIAVKFAMFRGFYFVRRFLYWKKQGLVWKRMQMHNPNIPLAILKGIFSGLVANLTEWKISREYPELPLAETIFSLGLVNIQKRPLRMIMPMELPNCPFRELRDSQTNTVDLEKPEHFGWLGGRIVLVDYGTDEIWRALREHYPKEKRCAKALSHL